MESTKKNHKVVQKFRFMRLKKERFRWFNLIRRGGSFRATYPEKEDILKRYPADLDVKD